MACSVAVALLAVAPAAYGICGLCKSNNCNGCPQQTATAAPCGCPEAAAITSSGGSKIIGEASGPSSACPEPARISTVASEACPQACPEKRKCNLCAILDPCGLCKSRNKCEVCPTQTVAVSEPCPQACPKKRECGLCAILDPCGLFKSRDKCEVCPTQTVAVSEPCPQPCPEKRKCNLCAILDPFGLCRSRDKCEVCPTQTVAIQAPATAPAASACPEPCPQACPCPEKKGCNLCKLCDICGIFSSRCEQPEFDTRVSAKVPKCGNTVTIEYKAEIEHGIGAYDMLLTTRHNGQMVAERRIPLENPYRTSKEECKYRGTVCETLACTVARSRDIEVEANIVARDSTASLDGKTARAGGGIVRMVTMPIRLVAAPFH